MKAELKMTFVTVRFGDNLFWLEDIEKNRRISRFDPSNRSNNPLRKSRIVKLCKRLKLKG